MNSKKEKFKKYLYLTGDFFYKNRYFFQKIGFALLNVLFATLLTFIVLTLTPTNSVDQFAQQLVLQRGIPLEEAYKLAIEILGYDPNANVFVQLWNYINLFHGNLGTSIYINDVTFFLGITIGSNMAWKRTPAKDAAMTSYIVVSSSVPDYLWGLIFLYVFSCLLGWFPLGGAQDINNGLPVFIDLIWHSVLPVMSMVIVQTAS